MAENNYTVRSGNIRHSTTIYKSNLGWEYVVSRKTPDSGKIYLKCSISNCRGTALIKDGELTDRRDHNHSQDDYNDLTDVTNRLKVAARDDRTNRSLRGIFNEVTREHADGGRVSFR